jgi:hypothetical protein
MGVTSRAALTSGRKVAEWLYDPCLVPGASTHRRKTSITTFRLHQCRHSKPSPRVGAAVDKERADGAGREARGINGDDGLLPLTASAARREASSDSDKHLVEHPVGDPAHEAVERGVIGHTLSSDIVLVNFLESPLRKQPR